MFASCGLRASITFFRHASSSSSSRRCFPSVGTPGEGSGLDPRAHRPQHHQSEHPHGTGTKPEAHCPTGSGARLPLAPSKSSCRHLQHQLQTPPWGTQSCIRAWQGPELLKLISPSSPPFVPSQAVHSSHARRQHLQKGTGNPCSCWKCCCWGWQRELCRTQGAPAGARELTPTSANTK